MLTEFRPTRRTIGALLLGLAAFVVFFGDSGRTIENGVVVSEYSYNYAAVILGIIAIVLVASEAYRLSRGDRRDFAGPPAVHYAVFAATAVLGLYQVLSGADVV